MKLGDLIRHLEGCKPEASVYFDFCDTIPTGIGSYRGYYDQLALGWRICEYGAEPPKVADVLKWLREACGATFTGYKGGEYVMDRQTQVWVANYGESHGTLTVGVIDSDWRVVIETRYVE